MKALSVRQPWAHLIIHGAKRIENRTWSTDWRGPLLIHASKSDSEIASCYAWTALRGHLPPKSVLQFGALIGIVTLDAVYRFNSLNSNLRNIFAEGPICWHLIDPRPFTAIPYPGSRSLFYVPDEVLPKFQETRL